MTGVWKKTNSGFKTGLIIRGHLEAAKILRSMHANGFLNGSEPMALLNLG